jgi:hypothetical protein
MTIRVTTSLLPYGMGIFGRKKELGASVTLASCASGSAVTALQFLHGVTAGGEFSDEEIVKVWSCIYAASIRSVSSPEDKDFLRVFLRGQISLPQLQRAFDEAANNPQEVLYIGLEGGGAETASTIAKDLAVHVTNPSLLRANSITKELINEESLPIFEHHVKALFPELQQVHQILIAVLSGSFSVNVEDICRGMTLYGQTGTSLRIRVAQTIYGLAPVLFATRALNE